MDQNQPVTPDVQLPGQGAEAVDLDPTIEPESPSEPAGESSADALTGGEAAEGDVDPELGNTLIAPGNS